MKRYTFNKEDRLLSPYEFKRVQYEGTRYQTPHFNIFVIPNKSDKSRLGITTSRKMGTATKRNRIKRFLREFFRLNRLILPPGTDILFKAKPGASSLAHSELLKELQTVFNSDKKIL